MRSQKPWLWSAQVLGVTKENSGNTKSSPWNLWKGCHFFVSHVAWNTKISSFHWWSCKIFSPKEALFLIRSACISPLASCFDPRRSTHPISKKICCFTFSSKDFLVLQRHWPPGPGKQFAGCLLQAGWHAQIGGGSVAKTGGSDECSFEFDIFTCLFFNRFLC